MLEERELLSRQQDAMREEAGPRELCRYRGRKEKKKKGGFSKGLLKVGCCSLFLSELSKTRIKNLLSVRLYEGQELIMNRKLFIDLHQRGLFCENIDAESV